MKKYLLVLGILAVLLAAGCSPKAAENAGAAAQVTTGSGDAAVELPTTPESTAIKQFTMTASKWQFVPDTIRVNEGDTVRLTIKSIDVAHGFALPEFGINERLEPGKTVEAEFVANKKGTFSFFCSVMCGQGHGDMKGTLVVE